MTDSATTSSPRPADRWPHDQEKRAALFMELIRAVWPVSSVRRCAERFKINERTISRYVSGKLAAPDWLLHAVDIEARALPEDPRR